MTFCDNYCVIMFPSELQCVTLGAV